MIENNNQNQLSIVKHIKERECTILKYGTKPRKMNYFFCRCDPNLMEVICEYCAENCHKGLEHELIQAEAEDYKTCQCGLKNHKLQDSNKIYSSTCYYHELSIISKTLVFYESSINKTTICMFCYNICKDKYTGETFNAYKYKGSIDKFPKCNCTNQEHCFLKFIPEGWSKLADNFSNYDFNNLKPVQIINTIFLSKDSFSNVFESFISYFEIMKKGLQRKEDYEFDKNIHLTNYFRCLKGLASIGNSMSFYFYFDSSIKTYFPDFILSSIIDSYISDSPGLWNFFNYYLLAYKRFIIFPYLSRFPKLKSFDLQNMSPLQRLNLTLNIHSSPFLQEFKAKYINSETPLISILLNGLDKIIKIKFSYVEAIDCMINITSIFKLFSQLYFFSNEQILKFCNIVDKLFGVLLDFNKRVIRNSKNLSNIKDKENILLINISKCLLNLPNSYNDLIVLKYIKEKTILKNEELENIKFLHSHNEIGKNIAKCSINIIYYITKEQENSKSKVSQKIINLLTQLISLYINNTDYFLIGLERDSGQDCVNYAKIILNLQNKEEEDFLSILKSSEDEIINNQNKFLLCSIEKTDMIRIFESNVTKIINAISHIEHSDNIMKLIQFESPSEEMFKKFICFNQEDISKNKIINNHQCDYQLMLNNCFILNTLINTINLLENSAEFYLKEGHLSEEIIENVFRILKFYINDNIDNCLVGVSISFLTSLGNIPEIYAIKYFNYCDYAFEYLSHSEFEFTFSVNYIISIKKYFNRLSKNFNHKYYCLYYFLFIITKVLNYIRTNTLNATVQAVREILIDIFNTFDFFIDYKDYLLLKGEKPNEDKFENKNDSCYLSNELAEIIFVKFVYICNLVFDDNATSNNQEFLEEILNRQELKIILKYSNLNIELRTELVKYYRMLYIDVSIIDRRLSNYRLAFIAVPEIDENENLSNNADSEIFSFLDNIITISSSDEEGMEDYDILMNEISMIKSITDKLHGQNNQLLLYYYEQAIFLPVKVFCNKFFSQAKKKKGNDILKVYDMIVMCLSLKYTMIDSEIVSKAFDIKNDLFNSNYYKREKY